MHSHHAVVHLAPVAVPLPPHPRRVVPALGDCGLVHHANCIGMRVVSRHDLLATVMEFLFIPLDGFEETL
jgi:hypothetical protein